PPARESGFPQLSNKRCLHSIARAPGLLATVACAPSRRLDTSVGVSGPHDFARPQESAVVLSTPCVHRILPRVSDVGQRPSGGTGRRKFTADLGLATSTISEIQKP